MTTIHIVNIASVGPVVIGTCQMHVQIPVDEVCRQVDHALQRAGSGKPSGFFVVTTIGDEITIKCLNGSETPFLLAALNQRMMDAYMLLRQSQTTEMATSETVDAALTKVEHWDHLADMG